MDAIIPMLYNIAVLFIYCIHSSLYLLILYPQLAAPPSLSLIVTTTLSSVSVNLFCFVIYIHLTFQIPHINDNIKYCLFLISFTKHNAFQVHESMLLQMAKLHSFLRLSNISLCIIHCILYIMTLRLYIMSLTINIPFDFSKLLLNYLWSICE